MSYKYRKAPNPTEFSLFTGLGVTPLDEKTLAKDVPCQAACPARTDVPAYIDLISRGENEAAYRVNQEDNVFPGVLGRVCTRPCEAACRYNWTNAQGAVQICHLKRSAADRLKEPPSPLPRWFEPTGRRVAVVGGGPAGLTAARELVRYGHSVTLFERLDHLGGMMVDGIPRFRLPRSVVDQEISLIVASGVEVRLGEEVDRERLAGLLMTYDAVCVATGTVRAKSLELPVVDERGKVAAPEAAASGVAIPSGIAAPSRNEAAEGRASGGAARDRLIPGLDFMRRYNSGEIALISGDVVVIGGGFTAVDCARSCARAARRIVGAEDRVTIAYRRTEHHMSAEMDELAEIRMENIDVRTLVTPIALRVERGELAAVRFVRNLMGEEESGGKPEIRPIPGSEFELPCRHLVVAIGQDADYSILPEGVSIGAGQRTANPKLFVTGDFLTGSLDVIHAVADAKAVADEIDRFLSGEVRMKHHVSIELIDSDGETGRFRDHDLQKAPAMPLRSLVERSRGDAEVERGLSNADTRIAATRCYLCNHKFEIDQDRCIHCDWCIDVSPRDCIKKVSRIFFDEEGTPADYVQTDIAREATYIYIDSDNCIRCGKCLRVCPTGAITMRRMERTPCAAVHGEDGKIDWKPLRDRKAMLERAARTSG